MSALGVFETIDIFDEPMIIGTVYQALAAPVINRRLHYPETLGLMESSLLGAVWAPTILMMNLSANNFNLESLTLMIVAGASIGGAAGEFTN